MLEGDEASIVDVPIFVVQPKETEYHQCFLLKWCGVRRGIQTKVLLPQQPKGCTKGTGGCVNCLISAACRHLVCAVLFVRDPIHGDCHRLKVCCGINKVQAVSISMTCRVGWGGCGLLA